MSEIELACIKLVESLGNIDAVERYQIMRSSTYEHPGWKDKRYTQRRNSYGKLKKQVARRY